MAYRELAPPPALASYVACFWARTGAPPRVLPDGCVDLVWTGAELIVAGPATRAVIPRHLAAEPKLGVRFRIGAAGAALGLPAAELLDQSPGLDRIWTEGGEWTRRIGEADGPRGRLALFGELVESRLRDAPAPDPLTRAAVLDLARPRARVASLGERLAISERQLRRRFGRAVGYSPTTLARVLRLQRFLALAAGGDGLARLATDAGYADQPHLTRDCGQLTGLSPAALLAAGAAPAGERLSPA